MKGTKGNKMLHIVKMENTGPKSEFVLIKNGTFYS